ncbi:hypothetical protein F511_46464 [Dorcoceras hygrometricum]|uniref:Uncharacterized protein n=1 Tax=Dorcoceras hygrometricum TaxID=472368 RepID=A0A2Z7A0V0_9LAMI|nr:hypothetical protein F511_46464 [Dorcoceras hygrometricum]
MLADVELLYASLLAARYGALAARLMNAAVVPFGRGCATLKGAVLACWPIDLRHHWRTLAARCAIAPRLSRVKFRGGRRPAAAQTMLRRISGDVVTAGLNSSRVWFGPVPGSP